MKNRTSHITIFALLLVLLTVSGCFQGQPSSKEPIHLNPNMDRQQKYRPQAESNYFEDGATMRPIVEGTVARGLLKDDSEFHFGKDSNGKFIIEFPKKINVNMELLLRGQERFNIYCSPCHGRVGNGRGIVVEKGMVAPPSFHVDSIRVYPNGRVFDVISNGVRNMPPYKYQVPVEDRWAIIAYFNALQRSQNATLQDVPQSERGSL